jgi:hypothetical protein
MEHGTKLFFSRMDVAHGQVINRESGRINFVSGFSTGLRRGRCPKTRYPNPSWRRAMAISNSKPKKEDEER